MKYKHTSSNIKVKKKILKKRFSNVCLYSMKLKHTLSNIENIENKYFNYLVFIKIQVAVLDLALVEFKLDAEQKRLCRQDLNTCIATRVANKIIQEIQ